MIIHEEYDEMKTRSPLFYFVFSSVSTFDVSEQWRADPKYETTGYFKNIILAMVVDVCKNILLGCKKERGLLDEPDEILLIMVVYMDATSLCNFQTTCRTCYHLGNSDTFWENLCKSAWGISSTGMCKATSNKQLYQNASIAIQKLTRQVVEEQCLFNLKTILRVQKKEQVQVHNQAT